MAATSASRTRSFGEFTTPGARPLTQPEITQRRRTRWTRRIVLTLTTLILTGTAGLLVAAPSSAVGGDELASICTPLAVMQPQSRGQGLEAFLSDGTFVPGAPGTETYVPSYTADTDAGKDPSVWDDQGGKYAPSYSRMAWPERTGPSSACPPAASTWTDTPTSCRLRSCRSRKCSPACR
ncbi:hypothetical protein GS531_04000 [Rhodococcus hoagii]|nr:hypothetical protein [Prescottella equi]